MSFRAPNQGEAVQITNLRSRPELNGTTCEVLSQGVNRDGFVTVRLGAAKGGGDTKARQMKVKLSSLKPARQSSIPDLLQLNNATNIAAPQLLSGAPSEVASIPRKASVAPSQASLASAANLVLQQPPSPKNPSPKIATPPPPPDSMKKSASLPEVGGSLEAKRRAYAEQRAAWKRSYLPALTQEQGVRFRKPKVTTDVTFFEDAFVASMGQPTYKVFPKEDVKLMDPRLGVPVSAWCAVGPVNMTFDTPAASGG